MYLKISHRSNVQLNIPRFRELVAEYLKPLGIVGFYLNIRSAHGGDQAILQYIQKAPVYREEKVEARGEAELSGEEDDEDE